MAELNLDPKLTQEACEVISSIMNGDAQASIAEAFQISKGIGEDNPLVEHVGNQFKAYQTFFNEQLAPAANKVYENLAAFSDFATMFNGLQFASAQAGDVGTVADNNYDAAKDL